MKKKGQKILIVVSRYNELITKGLEKTALELQANNFSVKILE